MKEPLYIITGKSQLTGKREQISRAMPESEAKERLAREYQSRKYQRYQAYKYLKIERLDAVQLTFNFDDYE